MLHPHQMNLSKIPAPLGTPLVTMKPCKQWDSNGINHQLVQDGYILFKSMGVPKIGLPPVIIHFQMGFSTITYYYTIYYMSPLSSKCPKLCCPPHRFAGPYERFSRLFDPPSRGAADFGCFHSHGGTPKWIVSIKMDDSGVALL